MELPIFHGQQLDQLVERMQRMRSNYGWAYAFWYLTDRRMSAGRALYILWIVRQVNKHEAGRHAKRARARRTLFSTEK
jgi:hypothetical protein